MPLMSMSGGGDQCSHSKEELFTTAYMALGADEGTACVNMEENHNFYLRYPYLSR